jgi:hypothetical protein
MTGEVLSMVGSLDIMTRRLTARLMRQPLNANPAPLLSHLRI